MFCRKDVLIKKNEKYLEIKCGYLMNKVFNKESSLLILLLVFLCLFSFFQLN